MAHSTIGFWVDYISFHFEFLFNVLRELVYELRIVRRPRKELKNNHILITGTGLGIGNLLLHKLARDGNTIHCVDLNPSLNDQIEQKFRGREDCKIYTYVCDVSNSEAVNRMSEEVRKNIGDERHLEYVINNAGIVHGKSFQETPVGKYITVMGVNGLGPMHVTKAFYSEMLEKGGHITNVASIAGLGPAPGMVDYAASKHAVVGFSRALHYELDSQGLQDRVKVTLIMPHLMNTGMFNGCTVKLNRFWPAINPEYAANTIISAIEEEREEMVIPRHTEKFFIFQYIYGSRLFRKCAKIYGNFEYMKTFEKIREH